MARIHAPGTAPIPTGPKIDTRAKRHTQGRQNALLKATQNPSTAQVNIVGHNANNNARARAGRGEVLQVAGSAVSSTSRNSQQQSAALTIRGLAGPHVVEVRNLAPGTTAADVEEAMGRENIDVHSCRLLQTSPTVIADIVCVSKDDADKIAKFDGQWVRSSMKYFLTIFSLKHAIFTDES